MPTTFTLSTGISLSGLATGTASNPNLKSPISQTLPATFNSTGTGATLANNAIDKMSSVQTLAAGGTVAIDLTNFTNLTTEPAQSMSAVRVIYLEHVAGSLASSISVFNAAGGNSFQGPLSAAPATLTLLPNESHDFRSPTVTGWVVNSTHKNFYIVNNDGVNAATIRYFLAGS